MVEQAVPRIYAFGRFELQPAERRLLASGSAAALSPRAFDVLVTLVERAGRLVTKDELLERVWPNLVVEENNVQAQVSALRKILGAEAIATVAGKGYRFTLAPQRSSATGSPPSSEVRRHNLPRHLTRFIGRVSEIAHIEGLLQRARMLTLTGSGGNGKTRLSLEVAAQRLEAYADGAWFAELAALADPDLVPQTVATALGVREEPGTPITRTLTERLKHKQLLLILDNCEHLLDACASLAEALMHECPGMTILATSRQALGIAGEQMYRVPSLSVPDPKKMQTPDSLSRYESVQLFINRALLVRPDFRVTPANASSLASLCSHLDGIPLAIELAAARARSLSVGEIDGRLDQRFRLLTGGSRTALPRHQTLHALVAWSYNLLSDREQRLLERLSAFVGGCALPAAEQVCTVGGMTEFEVLDLLTSLSDKSLLVAEQAGGRSRYRLLETVREYARERLAERGDDHALRERHRNYFVALAEEAQPKLAGGEQAQWLQRLEEEHENLRASLDWSLAGAGSDGGLRLCGALQRFWIVRGHFSEGRMWCRRALRKADGEERTLLHAKALNVAGVLACFQVDYPDAGICSEESLAIARKLGDKEGIVNALNNLGAVAYDQGNLVPARARLEECLAIARELGDLNGIARSLGNLGNVAREQGDFVSTRVLIEECLGISRKLGHRSLTAYSLQVLGSAAYCQDDYAAAQALHAESLAMSRELGDRQGMADSLEGLASVLAALGSPRRAARIWGAAERLRAEGQSPLAPNERLFYNQRVAAGRAALADDAAFDRAWQEGRALTLDDAAALAGQETEAQA